MEAEMKAMAVSPAPEPTVGSAYGHGWRQQWTTRYFGWLLLIGFISWLISAVPSMLNAGIAAYTSLVKSYMPGFGSSLSGTGIASGLFAIVFAVFVIYPVTYGVYFAYFKAARGEKVAVKDMFAAFDNYWNSVGAYILVAIIVAVGSVFVIVPGIIFFCKLAFVPYLVVDKKMGVGQAIKTSWRMTRGYAMKVFLLFLLAIPVAIAGLIVLGVGVIISVMWIYLAYASLYYAVTLKSGEGQEPLTG